MQPNRLRLCLSIVLLVASWGFVAAFLLLFPATMAPKNLLRLVVSRFPQYEVLYDDPEDEKLIGWLDSLECGHQVFLYNFSLGTSEFLPEQGQKRHRCAECAAILSAGETTKKKPARSVTLDEFRRAKAA